MQFRRTYATPRTGVTSRRDAVVPIEQVGLPGLHLKAQCCPNTPQRKVPRDLDEDARDVARASRKHAGLRAAASSSEENRDAVRPSQAHPAAHAIAPQTRSERRARRVPARGHRAKPETTRPPKTDQYASGNVGRITPRMEAQEPFEEPFQPLPKHCEIPHQTEHLTVFSTISALP